MPSLYSHKAKKALLIFLFLIFPLILSAQENSTIGDLQSKISEKNTQIKQLEAEILKFQEEVDKVSKEAQSLQNSIKILDLNQKKISADVRLTEQKINATNLSIQALIKEIQEKGDKIAERIKNVEAGLREVELIESNTFVERLANYKTLSEFWNGVISEQQFISTLQKNISELKELKSNLESAKMELEKKKAELVNLKMDLAAQYKIIESNKQEKNRLLLETKNKESNYKKLIDEKTALKDAFEKELSNYEAELRLTIDPNSLPKTGSGILSWPLDYVKITQYFGNTPFATKNPQIYKGTGHNGIDLRASIGTRIKSAGEGTVTAFGNTDAKPKCYSYGKWVLIDHGNGLSTLYAHLSVISVSEGQKVKAGQIIGYSGNTGASTGPHLHFTVYATQGLRVLPYQNSVYCKGVVIPIADPKAYLNPLSYL